jgi:hypothetical protein
VAELSKFFGLALSALVPLVNPPGDALIFMGLVGADLLPWIGQLR